MLIGLGSYSETTKSSLARLFSDSPMETQDSICHLFVISYGSAHSNRTRHWTKNSLKFCKVSLDQSILHGKEQEEAVFSLNFFAALCNVIAARDYVPRTFEIITGYVQSAWQGSKKSCASV